MIKTGAEINLFLFNLWNKYNDLLIDLLETFLSTVHVCHNPDTIPLSQKTLYAKTNSQIYTFVCKITQEHEEDGFYHLQSFVKKGCACAMGLSVTFALVGESSLK